MELEKKETFLGFEWKKIILPIILMILFGYQLFLFYSIADLNNNFICNAREFIEKGQTYKEQNNTELLNKLDKEWQQITREFSSGMNNLMGSEITFISTSIIDPFFPIPCSLKNTEYCKYYITEKTFDCANFKLSPFAHKLFKTKIPKYEPVSIYLLVFHFILLGVVGYLLSAIFLWILRNRKTKISQLFTNKPLR